MNIGYMLYRLIRFYELLILVDCILSWVALTGAGGVMRDLYEAIGRLTEPFVGIFRRLLPSIGAGGMGVDFSPMIAMFVLEFLGRMVIRL